jgi:hypothetical protein
MAITFELNTQAEVIEDTLAARAAADRAAFLEAMFADMTAPQLAAVLAAAGVIGFPTIAVAGQDSVVADSALDTLTLAAGANITITTDETTDTVTIAASGGGTFSRNFPQLNPVTGEVIATCLMAEATTTATGVANRMEIFPFIPRRDITITALSCNVTSGVASAEGKLVCYASDSNGRPTTLLFESSALDFSTNGVKSASWSTTLTAGETYWFGIRSSSTAIFSVWESRSTPHINGGAVATTQRSVLRRSLTFATGASNPWVWDSSELNAGKAAAVWLVLA